MGEIPTIALRSVGLLSAGSAALLIAISACGGDGGSLPVSPEEADTASAVASVEITPSERILGMLDVTIEHAAGAYAADGTPRYGLHAHPEQFVWSSSHPAVATVEGGAVTSVSEGTATITASVEGVEGTVAVTVRDRARFAWSLPIPGGIAAGNVMGADGTIYVGTNDWYADSSTWHAVSPQGEIVWTRPLRYYTEGIPAIGADGTLYISSWYPDDGGRLIALDPGGDVRWVLEDLERVRASPAIGPDGTIYVPGHRYLYAIGPEGEIRWSYEAPDEVFLFSSPAIASDGTIYLGGEDRLLYAIDPDGSLRWTFPTGDRIRAPPSIGPDGTVYVGAYDGWLYAVRPDGTGRWSVGLRCDLPWGCSRIDASPSIGADGTVYVLADGLFAVDPDGSIRWRSPVGHGSGAASILGADGSVYVAGLAPPGRGGLYTLDAEGIRLGDYPKDGAGGSPVLAFDGTIIVAAGDELIAIVEHEPTNGGYDASPWPTARGDRANSGRSGG